MEGTYFKGREMEDCTLQIGLKLKNGERIFGKKENMDEINEFFLECNKRF